MNTTDNRNLRDDTFLETLASTAAAIITFMVVSSVFGLVVKMVMALVS